MILQVSDVLKDAMGLIGAIEIDESPSSSDMALALRTANVMIDRWSSNRLMLRSSVKLSFPLVAGKNSYTIGLSGADVTAPKPIKIYSAYIKDQANLDLPLEIIDTTTYDNLSDKDVSIGQPMYLAYDSLATQQPIQTGQISIYATPDRPYILNCQIDNYLTEFVNLTDTVTFEPAYYEALIYNLAVRLFRHFNDSKVNVPIDIVGIANNSLSNIRNMNAVNTIAVMEMPGKVGKYNIYSDWTS